MPLPTRTVTGLYRNTLTGAAQSGEVQLDPYPLVWHDTGGKEVRAGGGTLQLVDGAFSASLVTVDAAGVEPSAGRLWRITERVTGQPVRSRYFALPLGDGSPIDVTALVVAEPGALTYLPYPSGDPAGTAASLVAAHASSVDHGDQPGDQGFLAWMYDPNMAGHVTAQSAATYAGRITLSRIILRRQITWSRIWIGLSGVDAAAVLSNCYLGVYDASGTLKGVTADISASLMSSAVAKPLALTAPFVAAPGTYFVAMLLNGTWATNSLTFKSSSAGSSTNANLAPPNLRYSTLLTGQTSLPASLNLTLQSQSQLASGWASQWYAVD